MFSNTSTDGKLYLVFPTQFILVSQQDLSFSNHSFVTVKQRRPYEAFYCRRCSSCLRRTMNLCMIAWIKMFIMVTKFQRRQLCHKAPREATAVFNVNRQGFQESLTVIWYIASLTSPSFFHICFNSLRNSERITQ